jgi:aminoglycoside phosphotransferase (APT) family kinase protein
VKAVGLSDYGHTLKYVERQVRRWTDQYNAAKTEDIPAVVLSHFQPTFVILHHQSQHRSLPFIQCSSRPN